MYLMTEVTGLKKTTIICKCVQAVWGDIFSNNQRTTYYLAADL